MLKEIYIDNYRRFLNSKIIFGKTVLIAGKNGAGKTTLIELLYKIKRFVINQDSTGYIDELVSIDDLPRWLKVGHGKADTHFILHYDINNVSYTYELKIEHNLRDEIHRVSCEKLTINGEMLYGFTIDNDMAIVFTDDQKERRYGTDWSHSGLKIASRINSKIRQFIEAIDGKLHVFILAPELITDQLGKNDLSVSGSNFSTWYAKMLTKNIEIAADVLNSYKDFLRNCIRSFIDDKSGEFTIEESIGESNKGGKGFEIKFSELSTGQKKLCIYYALLKMLPGGSTLVIDEFENHLSPAELQPLYDLVQVQQDSCDFQVIIVSHHHKTLNWYHDSALVFSLNGTPAHIKTDEFKPDDYGTTLVQHIEREEDEL
jgi:energy-coupling factor transporter ATP-binding protein EcfA2